MRRLGMDYSVQAHTASLEPVIMHCQVRIELAGQLCEPPPGRCMQESGFSSRLDHEAAQVGFWVLGDLAQAPARTGHNERSARNFRHALRQTDSFHIRKPTYHINR